jgi:hypothetical protein
MYIKPFAVEEWMNEYEVGARFNIAETCVDSVSPDQLFALTGVDKQAFLADLCAKRLTYGDIVGSDALREGICKLYKTVQPHQVVPTHGAADLDIKSGHMNGLGLYGMKVVSWFGDNPAKDLPALYGTSLLFDIHTGAPKALLNAGPITDFRTARPGPSAPNT